MKISIPKLALYLTSITLILFLAYFAFQNLNIKKLDTFSIISTCEAVQTPNNFTLLEIQDNLNNYIPVLSKTPKNKDGALSRNIPDYISVRFQNEIYYLAASAIENKDAKLLNDYFLAADYSFSFQNQDGSFKFEQPKNISQKPTNGDLLSGTIFFLATFSISLIILSQDNWSKDIVSNALYSEKIQSYKTQISKALDKIIADKKTLIDYDINYSNRLFYDALAFMASSKLIDQENIKYLNAGNEFLELGLKNQNESGYYLEKGGFDSSYQGVSLNLLYFIYSIYPSEKLWKSINCGQSWLSTKIYESGEIITEGNSRVGGDQTESFLGEEKNVASKDVGSSFISYTLFSDDQKSKNIATVIKDFYK